MHVLFVFLTLIFSAVSAYAWTLEPSVAVTAMNTYTVSNIEAEYELSGALVRLESSFDIGFPSSLEPIRYFWGGGLGFGSFKGDLEDATMASASLAASAQFDTYIPYATFGMGLYDFTIKLMLTPYVLVKEGEGVTEGDEKYGMGGGLEVGYKIFEYTSVNLGYHLYTFSKGKNSSTGQSGSLANDVEMKFVTLGISFPFTFDSLGDESRGGYRRSGRGAR